MPPAKKKAAKKTSKKKAVVKATPGKTVILLTVEVDPLGKAKLKKVTFDGKPGKKPKNPLVSPPTLLEIEVTGDGSGGGGVCVCRGGVCVCK